MAYRDAASQALRKPNTAFAAKQTAAARIKRTGIPAPVAHATRPSPFVNVKSTLRTLENNITPPSPNPVPAALGAVREKAHAISSDVHRALAVRPPQDAANLAIKQLFSAGRPHGVVPVNRVANAMTNAATATFKAPPTSSHKFRQPKFKAPRSVPIKGAVKLPNTQPYGGRGY